MSYKVIYENKVIGGAFETKEEANRYITNISIYFLPLVSCERNYIIEEE